MSEARWPIRTGRVRAPWPWVAVLSLPWAAMVLFEQISGVAITLKLREVVSVPLVITLVGSLNLVFNIFVGASCNYASDRIWTPWGRRKPFLIVGWAVVAVGCLVLPVVHTLWLLVALLLVYEMLRDLATPYESLCNEVVPPAQRGRANAAFTFARQAMIAGFFALLIGRWDDTFVLPGGSLVSGQQLVFWSAAAVALATMALVGWGIRETPPPEPVAARGSWTLGDLRGAVAGFGRDVFGRRTSWALYAVAMAQMIFWIDFGSLAPLLYTEQWGFSKQAYGNVLATSTVATLVVFLPLGGWLADRLDRVRMFQVLAAAMTVNHLAFYLFLRFAVGDAAPPLALVLVFKLAGTGIGTVGTICSVSLMFDYVPRRAFGTVLAGVGITRGVASLVVNNGIGLWVTATAMLWPSTGPDGAVRYNYAGGYLYLVLCGLLATGIAHWFARQTRRGDLVPLGVLEAEGREAAKAERGRGGV